jgi:hypothetical protein
MKCVVAMVSALVGGCTVATSELEPWFTFHSAPGRIVAEAVFDDVKPDGARIVATLRGRDTELVDHGQGYHSALVDLDGPLMTDEPATIVVEHEGNTTSSTMRVPAAVDPVPLPLFISRAAPLTVMWSTITDDAMTWSFEARCARGHGEIPPSAGTVTIEPSALLDRDAMTTCSAQLVLARLRVAPVAPAFAGGTMSFRRITITEFASTP